MTACNFDLKDWESNFFGRQIYSYNGSLEALGQVRFPNSALVSLKIKSEDYKRIDLASMNGFSLVEGEVVYQKSLSVGGAVEEPMEFEHFIADESLIDELNGIVTGLYSTSRFRRPWFTLEEKDNFYKCWLKNAILSKFDDCCLVIKEGSKISGFVTLKIRENIATIGLIGVAAPYQGGGIGKKLLALAIKYSEAKLALSIKVSTQISNLAASNFYSKNGFSAVDKSYWFYKQV